MRPPDHPPTHLPLWPYDLNFPFMFTVRTVKTPRLYVPQPFSSTILGFAAALNACRIGPAPSVLLRVLCSKTLVKTVPIPHKRHIVNHLRPIGFTGLALDEQQYDTRLGREFAHRQVGTERVLVWAMRRNRYRTKKVSYDIIYSYYRVKPGTCISLKTYRGQTT